MSHSGSTSASSQPGACTASCSNAARTLSPANSKRLSMRTAASTCVASVRCTCGLRRTRYRGLRKTHVQHVLTALACNVTRIADWITIPTRNPRPPSPFHALVSATG
ncbi:transposase [Streptomyces sp. NPDC020800]|uniref:transposase n=1 Tax=Streptomyces sp. NPDC020800 TaxID=3365092 RepID=UPI0037B239A1